MTTVVSGPAVRDDPPVANDFGEVVRIVGPVGPVTPQGAGTAVVTSVAAVLASTTLLVANPARLGGTVYNDATNSTLFLKFGVTASSSDFTVKIFPNGYYEFPADYLGRVDGIWDIAAGAARITELTP